MASEAAAAVEPVIEDFQIHFKSLFFYVGNDVEANLPNLVASIEKHVSRSAELHTALLLAVKSRPDNTYVYAGAIAALTQSKNAEVAAFVDSVVSRSCQYLVASLQEGKYDEFRILLRFTVLLTAMGVCPLSDGVDLLMSVFARSQDEGMSIEVADSFVYAGLSCVAFCVNWLQHDDTGFFERMFAIVDKHMYNRTNSFHFASTRIAIHRALSAANSKIETVPAFDDIVEHVWYAIHDLSDPTTAPSVSTSIFASQAVLVAQLLEGNAVPPCHLTATNLATCPIGNGFLLRMRAILRFEEKRSGGGKDARVSDVDYHVADDVIDGLVTSFEWKRKKAASLLSVQDFGFPHEEIVVRTIFSRLLSLPSSSTSSAHCAALFYELFQVSSKRLPPIVGRSVDSLFKFLPELDCECRDMFCRWFSFHIANFNFEWPWDRWEHVLEDQAGSAQLLFVKNAIIQCIELSSWDKIREKIPRTYWELLPPRPSIYIPFQAKKKEICTDRHGAIVELLDRKRDDDPDSSLIAPFFRDLEVLIRRKTDPEEVRAFLDGTWDEEGRSADDASRLKIKALLLVLFVNGKKSLTHMSAALQRYRPLMNTLFGRDNLALQDVAMDSIAFYWQDSSVHVLSAVDKFLNLNLVASRAVVRCCFRQKPLFDTLPWWRVFIHAIEKALMRVDLLLNSLGDTEDESKRKMVVDRMGVLLAESVECFQDALVHASDGAADALASRRISFLRTFRKAFQRYDGPLRQSDVKDAIVASFLSSLH